MKHCGFCGRDGGHTEDCRYNRCLWTFEGGACPRYTMTLPTGPVYVETHGPNCVSTGQGRWRLNGQGARSLGFAEQTLRSTSAPDACREALQMLSEKLTEWALLLAKAATT